MNVIIVQKGSNHSLTFMVLHVKYRCITRDFVVALALTNRISELAEAEDHHPAILTEWGKVTVTWWTHAINGLHPNHFIMAAKINKLLTYIGRF